MSDWLDVGEAGSTAQPDEKGCMIGVIAMGIVALIVIILCIINW